MFINEIHITDINIILSIAASLICLFIAFIAYQLKKVRSARWFMPLAYETIIKHIPDGLIVTDLQQRVLAVNPSLRLFMDDPQIDPIGLSLQTVCPYITLTANEASQQVEWRNMIIKVKTVPIFDKTGKHYGQLYMLIDLTAQLVNQQQVQQQRDYYHMVMNSLGQGITVVDADSNFEYVNPAYASMLGYLVEELLGKSPFDFTITPDHPELYMARAKRSQGEISSYETRLQRRDGSRISVLITGVPRYQNDRVSGSIAVITDLTQQKKVEQQSLALALEKERVHILSNFIRDASHEFRTPLAVIKSSLYILATIQDLEKQQKKMSVIEEKVEQLTCLVDMLLMMSELDSGITFAFEPTDLNDLIQHMIAAEQTRISEKNLIIEFELAQLPLLQTAPDYLAYALNQMIDNALRFTPTGSAIGLRTANTENEIIIEIRNTCEDMEKIDVSRVFERFYRHDSAHTTPGFGLGLPIIQKIFEGHNGQIEIESTMEQIWVCRGSLPKNKREKDN